MSQLSIQDLLNDDIGECKMDLQEKNIDTESMSSSEIEWHCKFKRFFKEKESIDFLKSCNCFNENDWKQNFKTLLNKRLNTECKAYEQLFELFKTASASKTKFITLHDMILTQIPASIISLTNYLYSLSINNVDVHYLPSEIGELNHLKILIIKNTPIYEIPDSISNLYNLQYLLISSTLITNTNNINWNEMKELSNLLLPKNKIIGSISNSEINLPKLERIDISGNTGINNLPNILSATPLKILSIDNTSINFIPVNYFKNLISLYWRNIPIKIKISEMQNLQYPNDENQDLEKQKVLNWFSFGSIFDLEPPRSKFISFIK